MTTIHDEKITCCLCGKKSKHRGIGSTNACGSPDIDTRPPEMKRSTMFAWVQRCPNCGYCSSDISKASNKKNAQTVIKNENYMAQLKNKNYPDIANSFLCQSMIAEQEEKFSNAAWAMIHAVWACDDAEYEESAEKCRIKAVRLIKKGKEKGERCVKQDGADILLMTDLLRRAKQFEEALSLIDQNQDIITEDIIKKLLIFQKKLISQSDIKCYTVSECLET